MRRNSAPRWRSILATCLCAASVFSIVLHMSAARADEDLPLPLAGAAYGVAQRAYDAYGAHEYAQSAALAREAIRQRPDVVELRVLLANALAAQGRRSDAEHVLDVAIAKLGPRHALVDRRHQIGTAFASGVGGGSDLGDIHGPAFTMARSAYSEYARGDYDASIRDIRAAIDKAPDVERLRYLLIDALSAEHRDLDAYAQIVDATRQFGDSEPLRTRRTYLGARIADGLSRDAEDARGRGDLPKATELSREAVRFAPDRRSVQLQLVSLLFEQGEFAEAEGPAFAMTALDAHDALAWSLRAYSRTAIGDQDGAQADAVKALESSEGSVTRRDARVARAIVADIWTGEGRQDAALSLLDGMPPVNDDTDAIIAVRRYRARHAAAAAATAAINAAASIDPRLRPVFDCRADDNGASCDVYAGDPGFEAAREARLATARGDHQAAVDAARRAVAEAPDDAQHRLALIDALSTEGDAQEAAAQARDLIAQGQLDGMTDMQAAFIAQRAGDDRLAVEHFEAADKAGQMPASSYADAGYAAIRSHHNEQGAAWLERAIDHMEATGTAANDGSYAQEVPAQGKTSASDTSTASGEGANEDPGVASGIGSNAGAAAGSGTDTHDRRSSAIDDARAAHAEATRNWGFDASVNYRQGGTQAGFEPSPVPGAANNWQTGAEVWWRPLGYLGGPDFQVYARAYESFGVKGGGPSGASTSEAAFGARVKPFATVNAIFAFERIVPIGADARGDWLARAAWSDGFGTALRHDVPSWWTGVAYAEVGHYIEHPSTYGTATLRFGRTYDVPSISPNLTVFPHAVLGADYDSTIDHSVPLGIGAGVSTRYWFRGDRYDTPRSFVDVSLEYRFRIAGDERARGVFFGAVYSW
ncbi:Bacteriophage N adsorption protein A C-term [Pararobbsia alpina]|uniref:NfrA family protein n=1 Tax=Pararobbsia alpina TaxID=621374 RepID=UPI0039A53926